MQFQPLLLLFLPLLLIILSKILFSLDSFLVQVKENNIKKSRKLETYKFPSSFSSSLSNRTIYEGCYKSFPIEFQFLQKNNYSNSQDQIRLRKTEYLPSSTTILLNNEKCSTLCKEKGYILSGTGIIPLERKNKLDNATSKRLICACTNSIPSPLYRVDTSFCNFPCSIDQNTCFAYTCCGSNDGQYFSVWRATSTNVVGALLNRLSYNYQYTCPTFRSKVEQQIGFDNEITLEVLHPFCSTLSISLLSSSISTFFNAEEANKSNKNKFVLNLVERNNSITKQNFQNDQNLRYSQWYIHPVSLNIVGSFRIPRKSLDDRIFVYIQNIDTGFYLANNYQQNQNHRNHLEFDSEEDIQGSFLSSKPTVLELNVIDEKNGKFHIVDPEFGGILSYNSQANAFAWQNNALFQDMFLIFRAIKPLIAFAKKYLRFSIVPVERHPSKSFLSIDAFAYHCFTNISRKKKQPFDYYCEPLSPSVRGRKLSQKHRKNKSHSYTKEHNVLDQHDNEQRSTSHQADYFSAGTFVNYIDVLFLEQVALTTFDESKYLLPRHSLYNGRIICENYSLIDYSTCIIAYGFGLSTSRTTILSWQFQSQTQQFSRYNKEIDLYISNRKLMRKGKNTKLDPVNQNFKNNDNANSFPAISTTSWDIQESYNSGMSIWNSIILAETRNWRASILMAPSSTIIGQLFQSIVQLTYRWKALLEAEGEFGLSMFDFALGIFPLTEILEYEDLIFSMYGEYSSPISQEVEILITKRL